MATDFQSHVLKVFYGGKISFTKKEEIWPILSQLQRWTLPLGWGEKIYIFQTKKHLQNCLADWVTFIFLFFFPLDYVEFIIFGNQIIVKETFGFFERSVSYNTVFPGQKWMYCLKIKIYKRGIYNLPIIRAVVQESAAFAIALL